MISHLHRQYIITVPTYREAVGIFGGQYPLENKNGFDGISLSEHTFVYITGMGKVNTAITLSRMFSLFSCDRPVIMLGIAGAYRGVGLNPGDIALISEDYFVDEAVWHCSTDDSFGEMLTGTHKLGFPVSEENKVVFTVPDRFDLPVCRANTVSLLPGTDEMAEIYAKSTGAYLETMEGAAFGLTAQRYSVPCVQVRAVSNYCGRNPQWNIKKAFSALELFSKQHIYNIC